MNVFLCCFQTPESREMRPYDFWLDNFKSSLLGMGHRVLEPRDLDFALPFVRNNLTEGKGTRIIAAPSVQWNRVAPDCSTW